MYDQSTHLICTYIHTYIHTYIRIYVYTYTYIHMHICMTNLLISSTIACLWTEPGGSRRTEHP